MTEHNYSMESSIPVVRMLDEAKTRHFYLDYLGFEIEWEHKFSDTSPMYMQIRCGQAVLHLNGHADEKSPTTEVRIPVNGLEAFCDLLRERTAGEEKPEIVDPRYEGRPTDLNLIDPSGNMIVFWAPEPKN